MGRPKANIDWSVVDKYLQAQCDGAGIASLLGIDRETLYNRCKTDNNLGFSDYMALKRSEGVELLRAKQYAVAMEGDKTMLVWLGKQYLGQKEKSEIKHEGSAITIQVGDNRAKDGLDDLSGEVHK